ncbi:hypothetical protein EV177_007252 [Coemansia sp. RSA 1804]|nr:hypothetical protein EV177_007252 [Coemansia sp. RSA 1804]
MELPKTKDGRKCFVKLFCVAGTTFIYDSDGYNNGFDLSQSSEDAGVGGSLATDPKSPRSPASFGKRSPHLSDPMLVQKLYLATEAGQLLRVYVSSKPFIDIAVVSADSLETGYRTPSRPLTVGNTLLYLGSDGESDASVDCLLANGDCDDHSIIRVSEHLAESSSVLTRPVVRQQIITVLENHCPVASIVLGQDSACWTYGRGATGCVQQAQFGHIVQVETILDMKIDDDQVHGGQIATRLWALNNIEAIGSDSEDEQLDKQPQDGGASLSRVVLYNEWSGGVSVVENQPGDWNVDDRLAHITSSAGIVLMCKLVNSAARNGLLLINRHRIEIVDVSVSDENAAPKLVLSLDIAQYMEASRRPCEYAIAEDAIDVDIDSTHMLQMRSDWIPNDIYLLYSDNTTHILAGLRDGHRRQCKRSEDPV